MGATAECTGCGAPGTHDGSPCAVCGADPAVDTAGPATDPASPPVDAAADPQAADISPPGEAKRIRGLAVPLVSALVVAAVGLPLTAAAVALVSRTSQPRVGTVVAGAATAGRARLAGAVTADGPVSPIGCRAGDPVVVSVASGEERYSILINVPPGAAVGTYTLQPDAEAFVTVSRATNQQTWTSRGRPGAAGEITVREDRRVWASFRGLQASNRRTSGTVDGAVEVRCG